MSNLIASSWLATLSLRLFGTSERNRLAAENERLATELAALRQVAAQSAQREANQRRMLEDANTGVLVIDRFARIVFGNACIATMLGVDARTLSGRSILDTLPPADRAVMLDALASQRRGKASIHDGHLLRQGDATPIPVRFVNSPIHEQGEAGGMLTLVCDLGEDRAALEHARVRGDESQRRLDAQLVALREIEGKLSTLQAFSRRQIADQSTLQSMNAMLQACTTPLEGATVVARFAQTLFDADAGSIYIESAGTSQLNPTMDRLHAWGPPDESDATLLPTDCWSLRRSAPYPLSDEQASLRCHHLRLGEGRHSVCLPLLAQGRHVGMINLRAARPLLARSGGSDLHGLATAQLFATIAAQYCLNLNLRVSIEQQALRDPLTGLFNRRYFNEQLNIEFQRALRAKTPLALMMIDIDHFKRINDRFGHETGDRVLKDVADVLAHGARAGDIVCRWGGEEFLILMPGSNGATARRRADEIRQRVKDRIEIVGGTRIGVSIGVAACPEHACDPDGLIEVSDRALLAAKGAGRNRVTLAVAGI